MTLTIELNKALSINISSGGICIGGAYVRGLCIRGTYIRSVFVRGTCVGGINAVECLGIHLRLS